MEEQVTPLAALFFVLQCAGNVLNYIHHFLIFKICTISKHNIGDKKFPFFQSGVSLANFVNVSVHLSTTLIFIYDIWMIFGRNLDSQESYPKQILPILSNLVGIIKCNCILVGVPLAPLPATAAVEPCQVLKCNWILVGS